MTKDVIQPEVNQQLNKKIPQTKKTKLELFKRAIFIIVGAILMAIGLEVFLIPNTLMDGGIVGISIILAHLTDFKLGLFIFILNIPFFYLGYKQIGKTFAFSTLFGIIILSIGTTFLHPVPAFTQDIILASMFGGMLVGAGVGIVIRYGGSLDGTEIMAILLNKRVPFSVGEMVLFFNVFIFTWGGAVFGWDRAMYSILTYVIASKTMDIVIVGLDESKSAWIISDSYKEIGEAVMARLGRGVTYLNGEGAYTLDEKKVVFCVVTRLEEAKLKSIVQEIDPSAFLAVSDIAEVRGGRFKKKDIH